MKISDSVCKELKCHSAANITSSERNLLRVTQKWTSSICNCSALRMNINTETQAFVLSSPAHPHDGNVSAVVSKVLLKEFQFHMQMTLKD